MSHALLTPVDGAALLAASRAARSDAAISAREFWLIVFGARRAFAQGRVKAGYESMLQVKALAEEATAQGDKVWARRYSAATTDLYRRSLAALCEGVGA